MKDTIFMIMVYMYIHYQRTENVRLAHNQVNVPTIAVGAHEQKTEGPFSHSWAPDSRHDHFQPHYFNYNTYTHALDQLKTLHYNNHNNLLTTITSVY